jgi:hypothetical protein
VFASTQLFNCSIILCKTLSIFHLISDTSWKIHLIWTVLSLSVATSYLGFTLFVSIPASLYRHCPVLFLHFALSLLVIYIYSTFCLRLVLQAQPLYATSKLIMRLKLNSWLLNLKPAAAVLRMCPLQEMRHLWKRLGGGGQLSICPGVNKVMHMTCDNPPSPSAISSWASILLSLLYDLLCYCCAYNW